MKKFEVKEELGHNYGHFLAIPTYRISDALKKFDFLITYASTSIKLSIEILLGQMKVKATLEFEFECRKTLKLKAFFEFSHNQDSDPRIRSLWVLVKKSFSQYESCPLKLRMKEMNAVVLAITKFQHQRISKPVNLFGIPQNAGVTF